MSSWHQPAARACGGLFTVLAVALCAARADARGIIDQQQTAYDPTVIREVGGTYHGSLAQTFIVGITGNLVGIDLNVWCQSGGTFNIDVTTVVNGLPSATVVGRAQVPAVDLVWNGGFRLVSLAFQAPVPVVTGQRYAIRLTSDSLCQAYYGPAGDAYAAGAGYYADDFTNQSWRTMVGRDDLPFRTRIAIQAEVTFGFAPPVGLWQLSGNGQWNWLHGWTPVAVVTANLDDDRTDDLVVNFGDGRGLWVLSNHTTWWQLHQWSPTTLAAGDFDNDGRDELVAGFTNVGLWRWDDGAWTSLFRAAPRAIVVGDVADGPGQEFVCDFDAGLEMWTPFGWRQLTARHPSAMVMADFDGSGTEQLIIVSRGEGILRLRSDFLWEQIHALTPMAIAAADLQGDRIRDLVVDFGPPYGVYILRQGSQWTFLHPYRTRSITVADRDASGRDELLIDFGTGIGVWQYTNDRDWIQVHGFSPPVVSTRRYR